MSFNLIKEFVNKNFTFDTTIQSSNNQTNPAAEIFSKQILDVPDVISIDIPTLIRVLEWAYEEAEDDVMIHRFVNGLIQASFSHDHPLNMDDYEVVHNEVCKTQQKQGAGENEYEIVFNN